MKGVSNMKHDYKVVVLLNQSRRDKYQLWDNMIPRYFGLHLVGETPDEIANKVWVIGNTIDPKTGLTDRSLSVGDAVVISRVTEDGILFKVYLLDTVGWVDPAQYEESLLISTATDLT
jgi:hypothetical protein